MKIMLGVIWLFAGVGWIYAATRQQVRPGLPASLFVKQELQTDKAKAWKMRLGVLNVMVAGVYLLTALFSHTN